MTTDKKYNIYSKVYDLLESSTEKNFLKKLRKKAIKSLRGNVLEIGIGTGANIDYYNEKLKIIGIDFSAGMLEKAQRKLSDLNKSNVKLLNMNVENLKFNDKQFDSAYATCVFCTVPDPVKGLKEVYRVLKSDGNLVLLEHTKSSKCYINIALYLMTAMTKLLVGTSMVRNTQKNIEKAGFKIIKKEKIFLDVFWLIIAVK